MIEYYRSIQNAVDYIEHNLCHPITIEDVSRTAFQSRWHFQRVFRLVTGFSVYEYIKRRRLAEAGAELLLKNRKIIDVALDYQYNSPEAFTRAFAKEYGASPSAYKKEIEEHPIFSPIDIRNQEFRKAYAKGDIRYKSVSRKAIAVLGKKYRTSMRDRQNEMDVPRAWEEFSKADMSLLNRHNLAEGNFGVYYEWDYGENFSVLLGAQVSDLKQAKHIIAQSDRTDLSCHQIKPCKYMVFTIPGRSNEDILAGWNYIYGNWIPNTGQNRDYAEDFDYFDSRFYSDNPESEIYIPIKE